MPFYAEECASMLAVTFSGGDKMLRSIVSASCALHSPSLSHRTPLKQHNCISQGRCSPALPRPAPPVPLPSRSGSHRGMPLLGNRN